MESKKVRGRPYYRLYLWPDSRPNSSPGRTRAHSRPGAARPKGEGEGRAEGSTMGGAPLNSL